MQITWQNMFMATDSVRTTRKSQGGCSCSVTDLVGNQKSES